MSHYWFFVTNGRSRASVDVVAESAESACRKYGWAPDDCVVVRIGELVGRAEDSQSVEGSDLVTVRGARRAAR